MQAAHHVRAAALAGVAIVASLVPAMSLAARPRDPFVVAAAFPAWWSMERVKAAVDPVGVITRTGRWNIVVVYGGPDVGDQLVRQGAWTILDPRIADCVSQGERQ